MTSPTESEIDAHTKIGKRQVRAVYVADDIHQESKGQEPQGYPASCSFASVSRRAESLDCGAHEIVYPCV